MVLLILAPCKDCENRGIGCHSRCVAYIKYKSELNDAKKDTIECQDYEIYKNGKIAKMQREMLRDIRRGRKRW